MTLLVVNATLLRLYYMELVATNPDFAVIEQQTCAACSALCYSTTGKCKALNTTRQMVKKGGKQLEDARPCTCRLAVPIFSRYLLILVHGSRNDNRFTVAHTHLRKPSSKPQKSNCFVCKMSSDISCYFTLFACSYIYHARIIYHTLTNTNLGKNKIELSP